MFFHEFGNEGERQLTHHAHESPYFKRFQRHTDQVLVKEGTDKEDNHGSGGFGVAEFRYWDVQVTNAPSVGKNRIY